MIVYECDDWNHFERRLDGYFAKDYDIRDSFVFRGVADSSWGLETTLDRFAPIQPEVRIEQSERLVEIFSEQCLGLSRPRKISSSKNETDDEFDLIARHHGLPSPILDWTKSPFIAAYFAFADAAHKARPGPERVGIYMFNKTKGLEVADDEGSQERNQAVLEISDHRLLVANHRAIEQQSIFYKVLNTTKPLKDVLSPWLYLYTIPASHRGFALAKLDGMNINHRALFKDLDAAAVTAMYRFETAGAMIRG